MGRTPLKSLWCATGFSVKSVRSRQRDYDRTHKLLHPPAGKYIEYDFPLREVNRLAEKEAYAKKPIHIMHKWWARRLSSVFRTVLLASAVDWTDWVVLEPWKQGSKNGDVRNGNGKSKY
jgi:hypothetical protein